MTATKNIVIVALAGALLLVGYYYYQRTRNDVTIQLPSVEMKR